MMQQRRWIWIFILIMIVAFIAVLFSLNRQKAIQDNVSHTLSETALSEQQKHSSDGPAKDVRADGKSGKERANIETSEPVSSSASNLLDSKQKRIEKVYERLSREGVSFTDSYPREVIAIMVEGMDAFSAAEYLRERSLYEHALEYAEKALAENPDSSKSRLQLKQIVKYSGQVSRDRILELLAESEMTSSLRRKKEIQTQIANLTSEPHQSLRYGVFLGRSTLRGVEDQYSE